MKHPLICPICVTPSWASGAMFLLILGTLLIVASFFVGCSGPSKERLGVLLHECREANRERARIIHDYEGRKCDTHPAQKFGNVGMGEAGF